MALEIFPVDLSSSVIASTVSLVVVLISYLIYKVGIGETSFEEVIEEQKKRSIEEELKQKSEKVKKEKKFKKTWSKKSKEKTEAEVSPEVVHVPETKDISSTIEIIEPKESKSLKQRNKSKSSSMNQQFSDALPLQEKVKKAEILPAIEKSVQEKKKVVSETEKIKVESKVSETAKLTEVKENMPISPLTTIQTAPQPVVIMHKKKRKEQVEKDTVPITPIRLLALIKESELESEEIQNLIDVLLNKQKDSSGWKKINDPLALTKKNLHEKEQLLDQEQRQNQAVTSKLKDLREDYNTLKAKFSAQEKANQEKIARQQQDIQNLTTRVKQIQEQLTAEREKTAQIDKDNEKKLQASLKTLEEEKAKLLQKISKLESESRSGASKVDYEALKASKEGLQKVHNLLVQEHTHIVSVHKNDVKNLNAQLSDAKAQIEELCTKNKALSEDCKIAKESVSTLEMAKRNIEDKLKVEEKRYADLDAQVKQLTAKVVDFAQMQAELKDLRLENERLTEQLVSTKERVAGDGQEMVHQNGELNGKTQGVNEKLLDEKEKILKEKESLVIELNEDLNKEKAKVALLNEEIEVQKQKNNELREKNWKAMEALKNAEQQIKEIQTSTDQKIAQLQKDFTAEKQSYNNTKNESTLKLTEQLKKAESGAAQRLLDYNKELEKNKQLSLEIVKVNELREAADRRIEEIERTVEELKSDLEESHSNTKECLQRIYSGISVDNSLPFDKWLLEYEQQVTTVIKSVISQSLKIDELQEKEKEYLEKHRHYEQVLEETESTLLQLQKSAESQELVWQEKLKIKQQELEQVKSERDALVKEKETMQSTFQQMGQLEELQEKLKLLQSTLESAESERSHLEQKYDEVHKNCINLRDQLENKEKEILDLQKGSGDVDNLNKKIEELKSNLDKEKKINKDFSAQMIKLNSLVKIGQDALLAEQEMVKKLKAQLEASQVSTANGTTTATKASPVTNSEDALDKK